MGLGASLLVAVPALGGIAACRAPTEITIELTTDVKCADVTGTAITIGDLAGLDGKPSRPKVNEVVLLSAVMVSVPRRADWTFSSCGVGEPVAGSNTIQP